MVFNSYTFLIFFTVVLSVTRSPLSWQSKKAFLLIASYLFYAAWNPPFVVLLWLSTAVDWFICRKLYRCNTTLQKKLLVSLSLLVNLGLLAYFKYGSFALHNLVLISQAMGVDFKPAPMNIILPIGISFYTFQTLSYTIDVYREKLKPWNSFRDYALYVTFFPQLVAGPIVRATNFLPQTIRETKASQGQLAWGLTLMILGLFQKVVIADGLLAPVVESVYDSLLAPSPLAAGVSTIAFAGQIFCDFAGYSTIAIGSAMCLGFTLPDNFRFPYAAIGFSDFWRRWHISLSTWLRDYLYISVGGNRHGKINTYRNLMLTMLLGGLWHGASWNFVVWGGLHGGYLVSEKLLAQMCGTWSLWRHKLVKVLLAAVTFGLTCFAWIFFRAPDLTRALDFIAALTLQGKRELYVSTPDTLIVLVVIGSILSLHWILRNTTLEYACAKLPFLIRAAVLACMLTAIYVSPGEDRAFIYFQF